MDRRYGAGVACAFLLLFASFAKSSIQQNEKIVSIGRAIFNDAALSADAHVACASCHRPTHAFSDERSLAIGVFDRVGSRHAPSLGNIGSSIFFWDGRRTQLRDAVSDPFFMPREMGLSDETELVERLKHEGYTARFAAAFPESPDISLPHVQTALVAYVRSLSVDSSKYQYPASAWGLQGSAKHGMQVFFGKAQCATCHSVSDSDGRFTDDRFHPSALGTQDIAPQLANLVTETLANPVSGRQLGAWVGQRKDLAELGRFLVSDSPSDINMFRTPSLLNVASTAPYMHDGSVPTLEKAVDLEIYYRSLQAGKPLHLTADERTDLLAFLNTLRVSETPYVSDNRP